jgi:hypothetical protein
MTFRVADLMLEPVVAEKHKHTPGQGNKPAKPPCGHKTCHTCTKPTCGPCTKTALSTCSGNTDELSCDCPGVKSLELLQGVMRAKLESRSQAAA